MGGKKGVRGTYPRHLKSTGRGVVECDASGFLRPAGRLLDDVRQGRTIPRFADITPGFGTFHPQDVISLGDLDDPKAIENAKPKDNNNYSIQDLGISDQEVKLSIQEGRPPRKGY
jgi:hypothetical protein